MATGIKEESATQDVKHEKILLSLPTPVQETREDRVFKAMTAPSENQTKSRGNVVQQRQLDPKSRGIGSVRDQLEAGNQAISAKQREIDSKQMEIHSKRREINTRQKDIDQKQREIDSILKEIATLSAEIQSLKEEKMQQRRKNDLLRQQLERQSIPYPKPATVEPVNPETRLQWRRCPDLPVAIREAQAVSIGDKVYIGASSRFDVETRYLVIEYDTKLNTWLMLPPSPVKWYALGQFKGCVITVGGDFGNLTYREECATNLLHCYKEGSKIWEEYLQPMPTARFFLSVISTQSAIIACGGVLNTGENCTTVEVYTDESHKWHTAEPLPFCVLQMTPITIDDTCYLLGGYDASGTPTKNVICAPLSGLIDKTKSTLRWKMLKGLPLLHSVAGSLSGCVLAVGGRSSWSFPSVHLFQPQNNSWVRMTSSDLPVSVSGAAAIQIPGNKLLVCGGFTSAERASNKAFIGRIRGQETERCVPT